MWTKVDLKIKKASFVGMMSDANILEVTKGAGLTTGQEVIIDDNKFQIINVIEDARDNILIAEVEEVTNEQVSRRVGDSTERSDVPNETDA